VQRRVVGTEGDDLIVQQKVRMQEEAVPPSVSIPPEFIRSGIDRAIGLSRQPMNEAARSYSTEGTA
jgi:hypothetical protein